MDTATRATTVLLVEDEAIIALAEAQEIQTLGYGVKTARRGEEAVRLAITDASIDLVLMDIDLGDGMDGTEAAARILKGRDLPVIFLSSHTERDIVEKTSRITNYGYVTKSADSTVLDASIRMAMRLFAATRQVRGELEQRKRYEHALTESTSLNQHIINNLSEGLIVYDTDLRYLVWNLFMEKLTGRKASDILGQHPFQVFPELKEVGVIANLEAALSGKTPTPVEFTISFGEQPIRVVHSTAPLRNAEDRVIGAVSTVQDVTQARVNQDRLLKSEAKYRELFENAPVGIFRTDSKGRLLEANSAFAHMYGLASSEEALSYYTDLGNQLWIDPEQRKNNLKRLVEDGRVENYEIEHRTTDGRPIWVSSNVRMSKPNNAGAFAIEGFLIDITRMRESEKRLEESNARIGAMLEAIPDLVFRIDGNGVYLDYKGRAEDLYVAPEVKIIGKHCRDVLPPDTAVLYEQKIRETIEHQTLTTYTYTLEIRRKGLRLREARMVPSGENEVTVVVRDITEEAEKEARLAESEHLFRTAFDNAPIGVIFASFDGTLTRVNQAYCDMLGYSPQELIGRSVVDLTVPEDAESSIEAFERYQREDFKSGLYSKRYVHKDGSIVWAEVNSTVVSDSKGRPKYGVAQVRNITEQKKSEESVRALVKEKEMLLSEIHHRIKNNLQTMASLLSLQAQTIGEAAAVSALEEAQSRLRTMSVLYDRLHKAANFSEISIADFLSSLTDDIVSSNPSTAYVEVVKNIEDFPVSAQKLSNLGIVVNELICNAMKYAYNGRSYGKLTVEARRNNGRAVVAIADDGVGLPDEVEIGTSEGFGMVVVGALTKQLQGEVRVKREGGTTFEIEFPICQEDNLD